MRLRRSLTGLAAIPVAAATLFIGSTSASASTVRPDSGAVCNPGCSANATFQSNGEIFTVDDYSPDSCSTKYRKREFCLIEVPATGSPQLSEGEVVGPHAGRDVEA
jgi:hypothetical protein